MTVPTASLGEEDEEDATLSCVCAGKILVSLWLPVTAELWLRKATVTSGKKDVEAAVLFQKVRVRRLYGPLTEDFPVAVDFTKYGRAVVATEDVKAGEVKSPTVRFSSVQFSPLTEWVVGGTLVTFQPRSSSSTFFRRPL